MPEYDKAEREIVDHFKREYIMLAGEKADEELYRLVVDHLYGPGVRDPNLHVDWKRVFEENQCPACRDLLSLGERGYLCNKCNLTIPLELYDRAVEQRKNRLKMLEEDAKIREKIKAAGMKDHRVRLLYQAAVDEAVDELDAMEKQRGSQAMGGRRP